VGLDGPARDHRSLAASVGPVSVMNTKLRRLAWSECKCVLFLGSRHANQRHARNESAVTRPLPATTTQVAVFCLLCARENMLYFEGANTAVITIAVLKV